MRFRLLAGLMGLLAAVAACQSSPPSITYIMEVTKEVTREVTVVVTANPAITGGPLPLDTLTLTQTPATPAATPTATLTPTPDIFPTPVVGQIYVAQQNFEHGMMFWLQPVKQIWVATTDEQGRRIWAVYDDTFTDGQPEINPTLTPPAGLVQPERGFGKLWRENPDVQAKLGWGIEPEIGYVTRYEYRAGGKVENDQYIPGDGWHLVTMLDSRIIEFSAVDSTWQILDAPD